MEDCDVVVIGGGIVGLSTARALTSRRPGLRVLVLEKEDQLARHQTGRNSGVIHSGIYYPPGSTKARYALAGSQAMYAFCKEQGLPARRTGKLIVATDEAELAALAALESRAAAHGLECHRLTPEQIRDHEPHITCGRRVAGADHRRRRLRGRRGAVRRPGPRRRRADPARVSRRDGP